MAKIDDEIEDVKKQLQYYFRNRQKHLDSRDKFAYYHERCIAKEERLAKLLEKQNKTRRKK